MNLYDKPQQHLSIFLLVWQPHFGNKAGSSVAWLYWRNADHFHSMTLCILIRESEGIRQTIASMPSSSVKLPGIRIFGAGWRIDMIERDILSRWSWGRNEGNMIIFREIPNVGSNWFPCSSSWWKGNLKFMSDWDEFDGWVALRLWVDCILCKHLAH